MTKKRQPKHLPTYTHERTAYAGIRERLALASLAYSKTWLVKSGYAHSVRFLGKTEGWEARFTWIDNLNYINIDGVKAHIALSIEGARRAWAENQHPSKELLAIVANVAAWKAA